MIVENRILRAEPLAKHAAAQFAGLWKRAASRYEMFSPQPFLRLDNQPGRLLCNLSETFPAVGQKQSWCDLLYYITRTLRCGYWAAR